MLVGWPAHKVVTWCGASDCIVAAQQMVEGKHYFSYIEPGTIAPCSLYIGLFCVRIGFFAGLWMVPYSTENAGIWCGRTYCAFLSTLPRSHSCKIFYYDFEWLFSACPRVLSWSRLSRKQLPQLNEGHEERSEGQRLKSATHIRYWIHAPFHWKTWTYSAVGDTLHQMFKTCDKICWIALWTMWTSLPRSMLAIFFVRWCFMVK